MPRRIVIPGLIACAAALLVSLSFSAGLFAGWENTIADALVFPKPIDPAMVIAAIDSESINRIGQWPWPREVFARAFRILEAASPKAVGFDVMLSEPSRGGSADDAILAQALRDISYPIVFPAEIVNEKPLVPLSAFTDAKNITLGHVNLILDTDGIVRKFSPAIDLYEAFSAALARRVGVSFSGQDSALRIVYAAPPGSIRRIPLWRLIEGGEEEAFRDKIVLIGATSPDLHDDQLTPFSHGEAMPGVEIQANIVNMFIKGYRATLLAGHWMYAWIWAVALFAALPFVIFRQSVVPLFFNLTLLIISVAVGILVTEQGIIPNFIHPGLGVILGTSGIFGFRYMTAERDKREIRKVFSKYVSRDVLAQILEEPGKVALGGEEKEMTVFFSDIRGFTTLSEKTTPKELVATLNRYFTVMSEEVLINGGVLDKYIGDAIMAFWGAPVGDLDQADNAVRAAKGMMRKLTQLNGEQRARGEPEINIGIGIYTGPAVVGNIGSVERFDYTVIGDTVNVASRLEGLNKQYGTNIIIGESTKDKCRGKYRFRALGSVEVKGRKEPLAVYAVDAENDDAAPDEEGIANKVGYERLA